MKSSAKAFQILSSGIYERKIEAIVRELSCNAYDSHVAAGKKDVPFKVNLPTGLDPKFSVEDFGIGLSEEEVYSVYTTYFESTKTDDNDMIGALGLGSKTPFSYTDSFTITARKDGQECVFTASISESGEPEVVKLYGRPWVGCNGVTVTVDVASADIRDFITAAEKVYGWFQVKPILNKVIDYDISEEVLSNIKDFGYHLDSGSGGYRSAGCKVVMGNVAYSIVLDDIASKTDQSINDFIAQIDGVRPGIYFSVDIGEADVAASRETLSLDDRTKANLQAKIGIIQAEFKASTIAKVRKMNSVFEAYFTLTKFEQKHAIDEPINGYSLADLKKRPAIDVEEVDHLVHPAIYNTVTGYDIAILGDYGKSWRVPRSKRATRESFTHLVHKDKVTLQHSVVVVINDCERKLGIKDAIVANNDLPNKVMVVHDKNTALTAELESAISHLTFGCYTIVYTSSFWDGKMAVGKKSSGGLADETVKAQILLQGKFFNYVRKDFVDVDKSRWAYARYDGMSDITIDGELIMRHQLNRMLKELDLDGIVAYNGNNEAKVKRIIGNDFGKLVKEKGNKRDLEIQSNIDKVKAAYSSGVEILEGYESFSSAILNKVPTHPECSNFIKDGLVVTKESQKPIDYRLELFNNTLRQIRKENVVLATVLRDMRGFDAEAIEDIKGYMAYLKQRKGK
jgi:hypothetical protein